MNNKSFFISIFVVMCSFIVGEVALRYIATSISFDRVRHELVPHEQIYHDVKEIYFPFVAPISLQTDQDRICSYCFRDIYLDKLDIIYTTSNSFEDATIYSVQRDCPIDIQCISINSGEYYGIIVENTENIDRELSSRTDCAKGVSLLYRYRYCITTKYYNNRPVFKLSSVDFEAHKFDIISHITLDRSMYNDELSIYVDLIAEEVFERHFSTYNRYPLKTMHGDNT
ncbi:hypothetical protein [Cucumibacter marinus]|uniref:hypothetical protein n=1 Tax=Cucumibacter marinus TaxID=1121252 RepID=UPI0012DD49EB|nr:hypothetical protein [Cucumibacter marinus]